MPDSVIKTLRAHDSILVTTHVVPDGDALGSCLAMKHAFQGLGKSITVCLAEPPPKTLAFLPGSDETVTADMISDPGTYGLAVVLDAGSLERTGSAAGLVSAVPVTVNIDHHATNSMFASVNWVDTAAAACGEQVHSLALAMGAPIDANAATCLFTAISTDTGSFRYSNTNSGTFRMAADLVDAGAQPWDISQAVYDSKPIGSLKGLAECIVGMQLECGGLLAIMTITSDIIQRHGLSEGETEGFIGYARSVAGVEVAVAFRELAEGEVKVGFRSKEKVDVAKVAASLSGGGHVRASGCTVKGGLEYAVALVIPRVKSALEEAGLIWTEY